MRLAMPTEASYFRHQAATCLQWASDCFDLTTATRLRILADHFVDKARKIEAQDQAPIGSANKARDRADLPTGTATR
jgi:hypothetical protein